MRKTLWLVLFCLAAVLPVAAQTAPPKPDAPAPGEWAKYAYPPAGYAVSAPVPLEGVINQDSSQNIGGRNVGTTLRMFHGASRLGIGKPPIVFMVGTVDITGDLPPTMSDTDRQEFLDAMVTGFAVGAGGEVVERGPRRLGEFEGRFIKLKIAREGRPTLTGYSRAYLAGQRILFSQVICERQLDQDPSIARFLDSLRLLTDAERAKLGTSPTDGLIKLSENVENPPPSEPAPSTDVPSGPIRRAEGVLRDKAINRVTPEYPEDARAARIQGDVVCEILIDKQGTIVEAKILSGPPELHAASLAAVRQWTFRQTLLNGKPVWVTGVITFRFSLGT